MPSSCWRTRSGTEFVAETPGLIAKLVNRLVTLDVRPAPREKDCGFCDLAAALPVRSLGAAHG